MKFLVLSLLFSFSAAWGQPYTPGDGEVVDAQDAIVRDLATQVADRVEGDEFTPQRRAEFIDELVAFTKNVDAPGTVHALRHLIDPEKVESIHFFEEGISQYFPNQRSIVFTASTGILAPISPDSNILGPWDYDEFLPGAKDGTMKFASAALLHETGHGLANEFSFDTPAISLEAYNADAVNRYWQEIVANRFVFEPLIAHKITVKSNYAIPAILEAAGNDYEKVYQVLSKFYVENGFVPLGDYFPVGQSSNFSVDDLANFANENPHLGAINAGMRSNSYGLFYQDSLTKFNGNLLAYEVGNTAFRDFLLNSLGGLKNASREVVENLVEKVGKKTVDNFIIGAGTVFSLAFIAYDISEGEYADAAFGLAGMAPVVGTSVELPYLIGKYVISPFYGSQFDAAAQLGWSLGEPIGRREFYERLIIGQAHNSDRTWHSREERRQIMRQSLLMIQSSYTLSRLRPWSSDCRRDHPDTDGAFNLWIDHWLNPDIGGGYNFYPGRYDDEFPEVRNFEPRNCRVCFDPLGEIKREILFDAIKDLVMIYTPESGEVTGDDPSPEQIEQVLILLRDANMTILRNLEVIEEYDDDAAAQCVLGGGGGTSGDGSDDDDGESETETTTGPGGNGTTGGENTESGETTGGGNTAGGGLGWGTPPERGNAPVDNPGGDSELPSWYTDEFLEFYNDLRNRLQEIFNPWIG